MWKFKKKPMAPFKIEGLVAASLTPFKANGDVDVASIDPYQKFLISKGVTQMYVNGSTGEGPSLTIVERKQILEAWIKYSRMPGREMKIVVQVGGCSFKDIEELVKHARALKVDAISSLPPLYFTPHSVDELADFCGSVAALAPEIPFYYYHIPIQTSIKFDMEALLIKARESIPSLRGIKFTSEDLFEGTRCLRTLDQNGDSYDILYGRDEQVLAAFAMGFKGAVGSTYNFMPEVYRAILSAVQSQDLETARRFQYKSIDTVRLMFQYGERTGGMLAPFKAIIASLGMDLGQPRFPQASLSRDETEQFLAQLRKLGFYEWTESKC